MESRATELVLLRSAYGPGTPKADSPQTAIGAQYRKMALQPLYVLVYKYRIHHCGLARLRAVNQRQANQQGTATEAASSQIQPTP